MPDRQLDKHSLHHTLSYLSAEDVAQAAQCSKAILQIARSDNLWARHLFERYDILFAVRPPALCGGALRHARLGTTWSRACPRMPAHALADVRWVCAPPFPCPCLQSHPGQELQAVYAKLAAVQVPFPLRFVGVYTDGGIDNM